MNEIISDSNNFFILHLALNVFHHRRIAKENNLELNSEIEILSASNTIMTSILMGQNSSMKVSTCIRALYINNYNNKEKIVLVILIAIVFVIVNVITIAIKITTVTIVIIIIVIIILIIVLNNYDYYDTSLVILIFHDGTYLYVLESTHSKTQSCCTYDFLIT